MTAATDHKTVERAIGPRAKRWSIALAAAAGLAFLALAFGAAVRERIFEDAGDDEIVVARLVSHQIDQTIRTAKIVLTGAALRVRDAPDPRTGALEAIEMLTYRLQLEPQLHALKIFDAEGRLLAHSGEPDGGAAATATAFFHATARDGDAFHIGYAERSTLDGRPVMIVGHRVETARGELIAVAGLSIDLMRVRHAAEAAFSLRDRTLLVLREDGTALFRFPDLSIDIAGVDMRDRPQFGGYRNGQTEGRYLAASPFDGPAHVGGFALSPDRDLLVVSGRAETDVMRATLLGRGQILLASGAMLAIAFGIAAYAVFELRRRRRLLAERERLLHSIELADAGIVVVDATAWRIEFANRAFQRATGLGPGDSPEAEFGLRPDSVAGRETLARVGGALSRGEPIRVDVPARGGDGVRHWFDLSMAPVRDPSGRVDAFVGAFNDVTARVEMEARLRALLGRAEAANEAKDSFLARMSHELRTPLNAVIGYAEMMLMGVKGTLSDGHRGYADDIAASGRHLLAIVEDVLEMARLGRDARALDVAPFDPAFELGEAATLAAPAIGQARATLEIATAPGVDAAGDARAFRQIAVNLIANAARHGRSGGRIRASLAPVEGARVRLTVADEGPGFASEILTQIGTPFLGRSSLTAGTGGIGLGLAIATELAKRMGGELRAGNAATGAVVTLDLPAANSFRDAAE